ncbi:MAG: hypothetical protein IT454_01635 [Planctomycetes bacterium]|nr:hypothetical protein [Planctomycetota bacterium]
MTASLTRLLFWSEPRSLAAFERRARAETTLLMVVAALAALSVVVTVRRMEVLPQAEPATIQGTTARDLTEAASLERAVVPSRSRQSEFEAAQEALALGGRPRPRAPTARSERDFYAEFLAAGSAEELAVLVDAALSEPRSRAEAMAALRAAYDVRHPNAAAYFVRAAAEFDACGDEHGESLPRASVQWLSERAARDGAARANLEAIAVAANVPAEVRSASARALIATVPEPELRRIEALFAHERDDHVFEGALAALDTRRRGERAGDAAPIILESTQE